MLMKKPSTSAEAEWTDPDDAPVLTPEQLADAEVYETDRFLRRLRGRPPSEHPKEKISVRVDGAVLERLRASGPGWQTRVNTRLAKMMRTDMRLWEWMEAHIADSKAQIVNLEQAAALMEMGQMRSTRNGVDVTSESLERNRQILANIREGIAVTRQSQLDLFRDEEPTAQAADRQAK